MLPRTDVNLTERNYATRFLRGRGVEIGAAQRPIEVNPAYCSVIYLDRLSASQLRERFPEIGDQEITPPDIICDVAVTGLSFIRDGQLDFVIASHLLEHLPNPLGFLLDCHRVLRESGTLLLIVPDKNYTFDRDRNITPLEHIIDDLKNNTKTIDKAHLVDFIVNAAKQTIPRNPWTRRKLFRREQGRSIHVHVWSCNELIELLEYVVGVEGRGWELCECYLPKGIRDESILVLRKTKAPTASVLAHFQHNAADLFAREAAVQSLLHKPYPSASSQEG
jgi:SAM-dependent methyltransferase